MGDWVLLAYKLPREPSAPRVAVWRALQRLGGAYLLDGAYVVKRDAAAALALEQLAHDIRNWGGEASVLDIAKVDDPGHFLARLGPEPARPRKGKVKPR